MTEQLYKLAFFVPGSHKEAVKQAIFTAGAGRYDDYDSCSWEVAGNGQFRPLAGSQPFIGERDRLETVAEYRVETLVRHDLVRPVLEALLQAHPYETPAYEVWSVQTLEDF